MGIRTVVRGIFVFGSVMIGLPCFFGEAVRWRLSRNVVSSESARDDAVALEVSEQLREHAICLDERRETVPSCLQCRPGNIPVRPEDGVRKPHETMSE